MTKNQSWRQKGKSHHLAEPVLECWAQWISVEALYRKSEYGEPRREYERTKNDWVYARASMTIKVITTKQKNS